MRKYTSVLLGLLFTVIIVTACNDTVWDELPSPISSFIAQYFPGEKVQSYSEKSDSYYVTVKSGASLVFDVNYDWTSIDGNGEPLPAQLVFDQFPSPLYDYIDGQMMQSDVYAVTRNKSTYEVTLADTRISYDIQTETVVYPSH